MAQPNRVKDLLESSPWALGAVAGAAVLAFAFLLLEQGLRLWDRFAAKPETPAMEIAQLRRFSLVPVTPAMRDMPVVRSVQEVSGMLGSRDRTRVPLWPVQLLVVNPTRETLELHGCRMRIIFPADMYKEVRLPGPLESSEYFLSDAIASVEARAAGKPIAVAPAEARRVQLYFLFALLNRLGEDPDKARSWFATFADPVTAEVSCRDQTRRELTATSTIYGNLLPEKAGEDRPAKPPARAKRGQAKPKAL